MSTASLGTALCARYPIWGALWVALSMAVPAAGAAEWSPSRPVEIVVPAGGGGGADQMARQISKIVSRHKLMAQPLTVINKAGGIGAEGYLALKNAKGDAHILVLSLSNMFTTPVTTGARFSWRELTPVAMLAQDEFVLWVNADARFTTADQYLSAVKAEGPHKFRMGGTGLKQEDQLITSAIERARGVKFTYLPFKGGGDVAAQLAGKRIDSSVSNPIEGLPYWRSSKLRPLCVFCDQGLQHKAKVTATLSWNEIPSCSDAGIGLDYKMLRGIFMPAGVTRGQVDFFVDLFKKVTKTTEWQNFMEEGAYHRAFMSGPEFVKWLDAAEARHRRLLSEAGLIAVQPQ